MPSSYDRRTFIRHSLLTSVGGTLAVNSLSQSALAQNAPQPAGEAPAAAGGALPQGKIGDLQVSRLLLGGNLLTHFTHSRDLQYVYNLAKHYNTVEKIWETMALAEKHGVNTVVIHTAPGVMDFLQRYRNERGGKIQWIICPTAPIDDSMEEFRKQVREIVEAGVDAVYVWGVRSDQLVAQGRPELIAKAVAIAKEFGVPCGVGAHDLRVITACEKNGANADFYIKTFHHHNYPSGPKPEEIKDPYAEFPGYWCSHPNEVVEVMKDIGKPWIAFKVMAAGAIPPESAFQFAFDNGADHVLAGMFDFEIAEDVQIAKTVLEKVNRKREWVS
ncbi:MAG: hypothetical protein ACE15F_04225 [bacterium]